MANLMKEMQRMSWVKVHVKLCLIVQLIAEMHKLTSLPWTTPQGNRNVHLYQNAAKVPLTT